MKLTLYEPNSSVIMENDTWNAESNVTGRAMVIQQVEQLQEKVNEVCLNHF